MDEISSFELRKWAFSNIFEIPIGTNVFLQSHHPNFCSKNSLKNVAECETRIFTPIIAIATKIRMVSL